MRISTGSVAKQTDDMGKSLGRVTWKLTLPRVKKMANGNLLYDSGNSHRSLWQPRGVGWGRRGEGGSRERDICIPMADYVDISQKTAKFCKAIILKLKPKKKKKKKGHCWSHGSPASFPTVSSFWRMFRWHRKQDFIFSHKLRTPFFLDTVSHTD